MLWWDDVILMAIAGHGGGGELACTAMNIVLMNFGFLGKLQALDLQLLTFW